MVIGLLTLPGSLIGGLLWTVLATPAATFLYGAVIAVAALVAFVALKPVPAAA